MTQYDDPIFGEIQDIADFPVYFECEGYPDVLFHIFFHAPVDEAIVTTCVEALEAYVYRYNKRHIFRPIHYVSDAENLPDAISKYAVCVHVDFGNANPKALIGAIKTIVDTQLPIHHILLEYCKKHPIRGAFLMPCFQV